jgi:predicted lysophospholipase L1 biosynthesis ABC-type transport system permease subunit
MRVIGVVGTERVRPDLRADTEGIAYVPLAQAPILWLKLAVRMPEAPLEAAPALRAALKEVDPRVALADAETLEDIKTRSLSGVREPAWLIGLFATISTALAALGLYGVVSHAVAARTREIGVRMALGASAGDVMTLVLRNIGAVIGLGVLAGLAGALAATPATRSLLFEVSPLDPASFAAAALGLLAVGLLAATVPARRAVRVDPTVALRSDG